MTTKKQNIPSLRFPEFTGEWEQKKLGEFLEFKNGVNASKEQYGKGYKFINVMDIINNNFVTYDKIIGSVSISEKEFLKNEVKYGDILFQRSSETREEVGQATVYLDKNKTATFGGFVIRGQSIKPYHPVFLNYLLKTDSARKEITTRSGGSTRYNIGQESLENVLIVIANLPEQEKIASFLTSVDGRLEQLGRKKKLLEAYKKSVMQKIFSQQIRFTDDNNKPFPDWEERRLGDVAIKKSSSIAANTLENSNGEYKIYGAAGVLKKIDSYLEEMPYIGIVKDGAGVGRTMLCEGKTSVLGTLDIIKPQSNITLYFLHCLINSINFVEYTTGSTIPHIYFKDYALEKIQLPSLPEQQRISDFLSGIDKRINLVIQELKRMKYYKQGLLQQMFV